MLATWDAHRPRVTKKTVKACPDEKLYPLTMESGFAAFGNIALVGCFVVVFCLSVLGSAVGHIVGYQDHAAGLLTKGRTADATIISTRSVLDSGDRQAIIYTKVQFDAVRRAPSGDMTSNTLVTKDISVSSTLDPSAGRQFWCRSHQPGTLVSVTYAGDDPGHCVLTEELTSSQNQPTPIWFLFLPVPFVTPGFWCYGTLGPDPASVPLSNHASYSCLALTWPCLFPFGCRIYRPQSYTLSHLGAPIRLQPRSWWHPGSNQWDAHIRQESQIPRREARL